MHQFDDAILPEGVELMNHENDIDHISVGIAMPVSSIPPNEENALHEGMVSRKSTTQSNIIYGEPDTAEEVIDYSQIDYP